MTSVIKRTYDVLYATTCDVCRHFFAMKLWEQVKIANMLFENVVQGQ